VFHATASSMCFSSSFLSGVRMSGIYSEIGFIEHADRKKIVVSTDMRRVEVSIRKRMSNNKEREEFFELETAETQKFEDLIHKAREKLGNAVT
jgi:hypothetical protein